MNILDKIVKLRQMRHWSNNRLAMEADLSHSTVNAWFTRNMTPSLDAIINICKAFGITLSEFFNETETPFEFSTVQLSMLGQFDLLLPAEKQKVFELMEVIHNKRKEGNPI